LIHQSTFFLYFWLCFLAGVFSGSLAKLRQPWWLVFLILGLALVCVFWRRLAWPMLVGVCLIGLAFGWWRLSASQQVDLKNNISFFNDSSQAITIDGWVSSEPEIKQTSQQFIFQATKPLAGKILVAVDRYQQVNYGDQLNLTGKLKTPTNFDTFDWQAYLAREQIYVTMYQPKILTIGSRANSQYLLVLGQSQLFKFKQKIKNVLNQSLPQPQSGLLVALLLGDEQMLSPDLIQKLNLTSTRHIIAISGSNIVLLSQIFFTIFLYLGFWRQQIFYLNTAMLLIFVLMIGLPSSAVRAAIMAWFLMLAQQVGRLNSSGRAIIFSACLIVLFKPQALRYDIGFQLSFAAVLGLIYVKPLIDKLFKLNLYKQYWRELLTMTLAAQVATLPLSIYYFGQISAVGIVANLLIVPITPFLLAGCLLLALGGLLWSGLARIIALPFWLGASYLLLMVNFFAQPWWPVWHLAKLSWLWLIVYYAILIWAIWRWRRTHSE